MIGYALAQLHRRWTRYGALLFAILAAVALTTATAAVTASLKQSVSDIFGKTYSRGDIVVVTKGNSETRPDPLSVVRQTPGVAHATYDRSVRVAVSTHDAVYTSVLAQSIEDGPLQWRHLIAGRLPIHPGEVVSTSARPLGSTITVAVPGTHAENGEAPPTDTALVVGQVEPSGWEQFSGVEGILASPDTLSRWAGTGLVGEIRVRPAPGTSTTQLITELKHRLAPPEGAAGGEPTIETATVHSARLADKYLAKRDRYFLLLNVFAAVVAATALLVVLSAFSVTTAPRRREFALLRAVGASNSMLVGSVVIEAILLAVLGVAIGIPLGLWLGSQAISNAGALGVDIPLAEASLARWILPAIALLTVTCTVCAAIPAAAKTASQPLVDSLSVLGGPQQRVSKRLLLVLFGIALVSAAVAATTQVAALGGKRAVLGATGAAIIFATGMCLMCVVVIPPAIRILGRGLLALPGAGAGLAAAFTGRQAERTGALIAIVFAGSSLIAAVSGGKAVIEAHVNHSSASSGDVDIAVRAVDGTLPEGIPDLLRQLPGVEAIEAPGAVPLITDQGNRGVVLALEADAAHRVIRSPEAYGPGPGELVLGETSPLRDKLPANESADVTLFDESPVTVMVRWAPLSFDLIDPGLAQDAYAAALEKKTLEARNHHQSALAAQLPAGINPAELPAEAAQPPAPDARLAPAVALIKASGPADQALQESPYAAVEKAVQDGSTPLIIDERFSARTAIHESLDRLTTVSALMTLVALLIAAMGTMNTVMLAVRERTGDRRLLSTIGVTRLGLLGLTLAEIAFATIPASVVGAASGAIFGPWAARVITSGVSGFHLPTFDQISLPTALSVGIALAAGALAQILAQRAECRDSSSC